MTNQEMLLAKHPYIFPTKFPSGSHSLKKVEPLDLGRSYLAIVQCEVYVSMYITYNSISTPTPWAVAGPHGQLASDRISANDNPHFGILTLINLLLL